MPSVINRKMSLLVLSGVFLTQSCIADSGNSKDEVSKSDIKWTEISLTSELGHYNKTAFVHQSENDYAYETTFKTLNDIENGEYILRAFTQSSGGQEIAQIFAKNCGGKDAFANVPMAKTDSWDMVETDSIKVTGGSCTLGFRSKGIAGQQLIADDFELLPKPVKGKAPTEMLVGGDITYRNLITSVGGEWADQQGKVKDVLEILEDNSFNLARIRIYNKPGAEVELDGKSYKVQPGYQDLADAVKTAKAAKQHGMTIFVSLHYSDFWTNPGLQTVPSEWAGKSEEELKKALYDYTYDVMATLENNGVVPEFLSIGNEINNDVAGVSRWDGEGLEQGKAYFELLKKGYEAVKQFNTDKNTDTKVVIHLTDPGKDGKPDHLNEWSNYYHWIDTAKQFGLEYDYIGTSLYPFWTGLSVAQMADFVSNISERAGKPAFICEVGYPWTEETQWQDDINTLIKANGLDPDGPENYGVSPQGQLTYMKEFFRAMYNTGVVEGIAYWDPIAIDVEGAGWVESDKSAVEDTSFFDYQTPHRALESIKSFYSY